MLKNKEFAAGVGLSVFQYFVLYGTLLLLPLYVQEVLGYSATLAGLTLAPGGAASLLAMLVAGRIVHRINVRWILFGGLAFMLVAMRMFWSIDLTSTFWYLAAARFLQGFGVGYLFITVASAAYSTLPAEHMGQATGLYNLVRNEAGSVGIALASTLLAHRAQFHLERLVEGLNPFNPVYGAHLHAAEGILRRTAPLDPVSIRSLTVGLVYRQAQVQATVMSYIDVFVFMTGVLLLFLPLIPLLRSGAAKAPPARGE